MQFRLRSVVFGTYVVTSAVGFLLLMGFVLWEVRPRYVESMRRTMFETARIMAVLLERRLQQVPADKRSEQLEEIWREEIKTLERQGSPLRVFIFDPAGNPVLAEPEAGPVSKRDWKAFPADTNDPTVKAAALVDGELRVSVPVVLEGKTLAMVGVGRRLSTVQQFITGARLRLALVSGLLALSMVAVGWIVASRVARSLERLTEHVHGLRRGNLRQLPVSRAKEVQELGAAFEELRVELEGKAYVEHYTQSLAHEIKAPLSAIRGAAELLTENPPEETRLRFLENLKSEAERLRQIVERLLQLASLEARRNPAQMDLVDLSALLHGFADSLRSSGRLGSHILDLQVAPNLRCLGDRLLLLQAFDNLVQNAIDFSGNGTVIHLEARAVEGHLCIGVLDEGTGIPDYALPRIFERFYSLPRPGSGRKSSGLGLSFVSEVMRLHSGSVQLYNRTEKGVAAELRLPAAG